MNKHITQNAHFFWSLCLLFLIHPTLHLQAKTKLITSGNNLKKITAYKPTLFKKVELVFKSEFDKPGKVDRKFIKAIQKSIWNIKDGLLNGNPSSKERQKWVMTEGDKHHTGAAPSILLKPIPKNLVLRMRIKYSGKAKAVKIDIGHHIHSIIFHESGTIIKVHGKNIHKSKIIFPLNTWGEVAFEFCKGKLFMEVNGVKELIENKAFVMEEKWQVDIRGIKDGKTFIDWLECYKGIL
jgi:hypothetical protein